MVPPQNSSSSLSEVSKDVALLWLQLQNQCCLLTNHSSYLPRFASSSLVGKTLLTGERFNQGWLASKGRVWLWLGNYQQITSGLLGSEQTSEEPVSITAVGICWLKWCWWFMSAAGWACVADMWCLVVNTPVWLLQIKHHVYVKEATSLCKASQWRFVHSWEKDANLVFFQKGCNY